MDGYKWNDEVFGNEKIIVLGGWIGGWVDGLVDVKAGLRIAYSNQQKNNLHIEGVVKTKALTGCNGLAGSELQDGGVPSDHC